MNRIDRIAQRIKFRELRILLAVAQSGTMGRAAKTLSVSQPVVSKAVSELEDALGVKLFDRTATGIIPTAYGREMIQRSRAVLDELQQGVNAIDFLQDPTSGNLHIGCTEFGAVGLVPLVIERLGQRHPRLNLHVMTADAVTLASEALPSRSIELAMSAIPAQLPADIDAELLFEERGVIMAGVNSPWARRRKLALSDLLEASWVLPPSNSVARRHIDEAFMAQGLSPPEAQVATYSVPLCHQLLASGRYLSILPREAILLAKHLPIKPLNVELAGLHRRIGIMTLKHRTLSPIARLFAETARTTTAAVIIRGRRG